MLFRSIGVAAVLGVLLVSVGHLGRNASDSARARTAADAAALAAVHGGRDAAERLARANGAELVSFEQHSDVVVVRVSVGSSIAGATAGE